MQKEGVSVRIRFHGEVLSSTLPDTPLAVPVTLRTAGLSEVVCHLLGITFSGENEEEKRFRFVFRATQRVLQSDLAAALESQAIDLEKIVDLDVLPDVPKPSEIASRLQPDWVGVVRQLDSSVGFFLSGTYDGLIRVHEDKNAGLVASLRGHQDAVKAMDVASVAGGFLVASGGQDREVKVSAVQLAEEGEAQIEVFARGKEGVHENSIESCCFARMSGTEEPVLATGDWDGSISLWPVITDGMAANGADVGISKKRRRDASARSADVQWMEPTRSWKAHAQCVSGMAWDGNHFYTASYDHSLKAWDLERGDVVATVNTTRVATEICLLGEQDHASDAAIAPLTNALAMACADGRVRLWDMRAGSPQSGAAAETNRVSTYLSGTLRFHNQWCSSICKGQGSSFSLASSCHGGRVAIWDLRTLAAPVHSFRGSQDKVLSMDCLSANSRIVCGGSDNRVRVFESSR